MRASLSCLPLSSELESHKTVKTIFWLWLPYQSPYNLLSQSFVAQKRLRHFAHQYIYIYIYVLHICVYIHISRLRHPPLLSKVFPGTNKTLLRPRMAPMAGRSATSTVWRADGSAPTARTVESGVGVYFHLKQCINRRQGGRRQSQSVSRQPWRGPLSSRFAKANCFTNLSTYPLL